jgi:hypothetical protein
MRGDGGLVKRDDEYKKKDIFIREEPLTYDDYAALPDEGIRYELADGVLEAMIPNPMQYIISDSSNWRCIKAIVF